MKFNWGHGIVLGMAAFMIFILQYVIRVQTDKSYDNELVTENYYQEEQNVDKNYKAEQNVMLLKDDFTLNLTDNGLEINFPEQFDRQKIKGNVNLYHAMDQGRDKSIPIHLEDNNTFLVSKEQLTEGKCEIKVFFSYEGKDYLKKKTVIVK